MARTNSSAKQGAAELILQLRELGIVDHRMLATFEKVPRNNFVPVIYHEEAWERGMFPIECGQTMTSVDTVALALHALDPKKDAKTLELGTGTGYQSALLGMLTRQVVSVERFRTLCEKARTRLENCRITNVQVLHQDGSNGLGGDQLFDRIIANCSFDAVPKGFLENMSSGAVMVAAVGPPDDVQMLKKLTKVGSRFEVQDLAPVRFQPFIPGKSQAI